MNVNVRPLQILHNTNEKCHKYNNRAIHRNNTINNQQNSTNCTRIFLCFEYVAINAHSTRSRGIVCLDYTLCNESQNQTLLEESMTFALG